MGDELGSSDNPVGQEDPWPSRRCQVRHQRSGNREEDRDAVKPEPAIEHAVKHRAAALLQQNGGVIKGDRQSGRATEDLKPRIAHGGAGQFQRSWRRRALKAASPLIDN